MLPSDCEKRQVISKKSELSDKSTLSVKKMLLYRRFLADSIDFADISHFLFVLLTFLMMNREIKKTFGGKPQGRIGEAKQEQYPEGKVVCPRLIYQVYHPSQKES